jgi:hypothetical protein
MQGRVGFIMLILSVKHQGRRIEDLKVVGVGVSEDESRNLHLASVRWPIS